MWQDILFDKDSGGLVTGTGVALQIQKRSTVTWPTDTIFESAIRSDSLYKRKICKFVLSQLEIQSKGESPKDDFWIEHVLPNKFHALNWSSNFSQEEHSALKDTLANLVPLTSEMNIIESQNPYDKKRLAFQDSIFSTTRNFSKDHFDWNPTRLGVRADQLAKWAVERWPGA